MVMPAQVEPKGAINKRKAPASARGGKARKQKERTRSKLKTPRWCIPADHLEQLEEMFARDTQPSFATRESLADAFGATTRQARALPSHLEHSESSDMSPPTSLNFRKIAGVDLVPQPSAAGAPRRPRAAVVARTKGEATVQAGAAAHAHRG